ncbi:putative cobaltochelatase [Herbaspirillum rubrisubalbicans]|uniref:Mg-protoporphyrin IX chelatase n=1 Tax=Herbaspirillum rubrisubalbicans Os34 TaxID=1235827 RepID=A0A6M3ZSK3_9BURK|nr:putative cobaltochelatase [Herbaspirillum rubrisubalbicans]QJQ01609.1 magnesium chelatase [Herbaspirillum rubrisubalbicans Os34]
MTAVNAYPFAAIVGQPLLKQALLLCAVDPGIGGVLVRGDKGTAKSTAARGLTQVLPSIALNQGCAFHCAPGQPAAACSVCNAETVPVQHQASVPFVTLPLGATEDRVLGSLDLQQALQGGQRAFQPGLLAAAHRGILYIDEVNLLADHLVDVLLDVAAMGVNSVQREGLSVSHPARFTLIGTMNLEEGDLRPQLLDRFGLMVEVTAPTDKTVRAEVVRRRIAFEADPTAFAGRWQAQQDALRTEVAQAQRLLPEVALDDAMLELISHLCCEFEVASLRADIVMHKAARAIAALAARQRVTPDDVRAAAMLVLPHRRRRKPFEQTGMDQDQLDELVDQARQPQSPAQAQQGDGQQGDEQQEQQPPQQQDQSPDQEPDPPPDQEGEGGQQTFAVAASGSARKISVAATPATAAHLPSGRRSTIADASRGSALRAVPDPNPERLAVGATLRSAAVRAALAEDTGAAGERLSVQREDLHRQVRNGRGANLIVFVVDASGSMAAQRRMEAVKGAVMALLTDAYQRRDQLAVIAFRGEQAQLLLAPTRSADLAEQGLRELPTGGRTPLPHALQLAAQLLQQSRQEAPPLLVILSDGKANVALPGSSGDAWAQTLAAAHTLAAQGVPALVLDTESGYLRLGRAAQLAEALGAPCLTLEQLTGDALALTVRAQLGAR